MAIYRIDFSLYIIINKRENEQILKTEIVTAKSISFAKLFIKQKYHIKNKSMAFIDTVTTINPFVNMSNTIH